MTNTELRALERLEADAHYLARLIERTMVVDAELVKRLNMVAYVTDVQLALGRIESGAARAMRKVNAPEPPDPLSRPAQAQEAGG